jgi:hypothetical protein
MSDIRILEIGVLCGVRKNESPHELLFSVSESAIKFYGVRSTKEKPDYWPSKKEIEEGTERCRVVQDSLPTIWAILKDKISSEKIPASQLKLFPD